MTSQKSKRRDEIKQTNLDLLGVKHFCELASENLANFTFADKRLALEALRIEVWADGENISVRGIVPTCDIASTQLKPSSDR